LKPGPQAGPTAGEAADDGGMEQAAEWVEQLLEDAGGGAAAALRAFVRAFPPAARWGEPWPPGTAEEGLPAFAPAATGYAAALREVAAGRRRVRIQGRWVAGGSGTLHAGVRERLADERLTWSILATGS
jgi:hypothetical protein